MYTMPDEVISVAHLKTPSISNTNITASQNVEAEPYYFLNAGTNIHETWYVCHAK
jgi:hypothetical protein